jgi:hypothetical protein
MKLQDILLRHLNSIEEFSRLGEADLDRVGVTDPVQRSRVLTAALLISSLFHLPSHSETNAELSGSQKLDASIPTQPIKDDKVAPNSDSHSGEDFHDALSEVDSEGMRDSGCYINSKDLEES